MTAGTQVLGNARLRHAVCRSGPLSRQGFLEHLFAFAFKGMVYPQIWEDPEIDLQALALTPQCDVVAIASGGCNVLSYLVGDPHRIIAVDLNKAHVALTRLKRAAAMHLPSWEAFHRFLGKADEKSNLDAYRQFLAPHLDTQTRAYWERRTLFGLGKRKISLFSRNVYRHGLLGRFIGMSHAVARAYGVDPGAFLSARSLSEQKHFFETALAPLFDKRFVRWATGRPFSLYGLGIPPAQYAALASVDGAGMAAVLRTRLEKLTCDFRLDENYFAWQAFGRSYPESEDGPLPPYLQRTNYAAIHSRAPRIDVLNCSFTEYLEGRPEKSLDRFVLLDAQDWMSDVQLDALWRQITRTARRGARVIFRTAAEPSLLPGRLDPTLLDRWHYEADLSRHLTARDRSAIYGGFHLYVLKG